MTKNISLAIREISDPGPVRSSMGISSLGARRDGWGYFRTWRLVPSTMPGSISSVVLKREDCHDWKEGDDLVELESEWMMRRDVDDGGGDDDVRDADA